MGRIVGTIGPVVGSSHRGNDYIKAKYKKRTKNITDKEKLNRVKFALAQEWAEPMTLFLRQGFKNYSEKAEGFVIGKGLIHRHAIEEKDGKLQVNPALVQVSFGNLPLPENIAVKIQDDKTLQITWDADDKSDYSNDQLMVLLYLDRPRNKGAIFNLYGQLRRTGKDIFPLTKSGRSFHVYVAFVAADRQRQSNSLYLGAITH